LNQYKPLIFNHIPKTAGTSLRFLLAKQLVPIKPDNILVLTHNKLNLSQTIIYDLESFEKSGWMSLKGYLDWDLKYSYTFNQEMFKWSFCLMANIDMWNYWINNVKDKNYNSIVELHMNKCPSPTLDIHKETYDYTESIPNDLCYNKIYKNFEWITMLRNPVERVISEYYFIKDKEKLLYPPTPSKYWETNNSTSTWASTTAISERFWGHLSKEITDNLESYINSINTANTQVKWLIGKGFLSDYKVTENDCNMLIDTMESLDYKVGITEMMVDSLNYFNKLLNFNMNYEDMFYFRKGTNKQKVSEEAIEIIKDNNKWDIKLYNYYLNKLKKKL